MVNFGPLAAEIVSLVWGTPANSNGFLVLVSLLQPRCSTEANQTLHDVWPSPGLVHYIYVFGGSCSVTEFCQVQHSLCVQVLRSPILAALLHGTLVVGVSQTLRALNRGRQLGSLLQAIANPDYFSKAQTRSWHDMHWALVGSIYVYLLANSYRPCYS